MNDQVTPSSIEGFQEAIKAAANAKSQLTICGARSKLRGDAANGITTANYSEIVEHQANDFTITAKSGTPVAEVIELLATKKQYLPFDPTFVNEGATVGGIVAAGLNGPCRLRYGGIRDFIIGCQLVDGNGTIIRGGGKVVKNAAGFDTPKFMVGSAGRFGLLTELTFKVFPKPTRYQTLLFEAANLANAIKLMHSLVSAAEFDAIEFGDGWLAARTSGESESVLEASLVQVRSAVQDRLRVVQNDEDVKYWEEAASFVAVTEAFSLVKVPTTPSRIELLDEILDDKIERRFSIAGNVCLLRVSSEEIASLDERLRSAQFGGQVVVGERKLLGDVASLPFLRRLKTAFDPNNVFGAIEE